MPFERIGVKPNTEDAPAYEETPGEISTPIFQRRNAMDRVTANLSRSGASVALSETSPTSLRLMDELDEMFRRDASETEIAAFRARASEMEG